MTIAAIGLLQACVTARVEELRQSATGMQPDDAVVILARRQYKAHQAEPDFTHCLGEQLAGGPDPVQIYPNGQFIDTLFPWFEPSSAPLTPAEFSNLLDHRRLAERIEATGIRYLVWIDGETDTVSENGGMSCAVSPFGGGCFGFGWWDKDSSYEATIWDIDKARSVGKISTAASGTSYLPAVIIPIPLIARTQSTACDGLASQLRQFLVANNPS